MNYYWFNRKTLLKLHWINFTIKEKNKKLLSIVLLIKRFLEKMQGISIETCQKRKRIKKGSIKGKDTT